jgi:LysM repeat protein
MKKVISVPGFAVCLALVFSCAGTSAPVTTTQAAAQKEVEEEFKTVYDEYRGDLILDGAKNHTVVKGDMLSAISRKYYNNGFYFPLIMLASSAIVLDPDKIEPDMKLIIPDLQKNLDDARAKGKLKDFLKEIAVIYDNRNRPADAAGLRKLADSL